MKTIIKTYINTKNDPGATIVPATFENVVGRQVIDWSTHCGTYGMGGPGFFGLKFDNEEWLILKLWGADGWLHINDRVLSADTDRNKLNLSLDPIFPRDMCFKDSRVNKKILTDVLQLPATITEFEFSGNHGHLMLGNNRISIEEDYTKRSVYRGTSKPHIFPDDEDLKDAWIIASVPWVLV